MKFVERIAQQIADDLCGSCKSYPEGQNLLDALYNMGKISSDAHSSDKGLLWADRVFLKIEDEVCKVIDDTTFLCDSCGWWCEQGEQSDNYQVCNDCEDEY